jgi:hypothetical protein
MYTPISRIRRVVAIGIIVYTALIMVSLYFIVIRII